MESSSQPSMSRRVFQNPVQPLAKHEPDALVVVGRKSIPLLRGVRLRWKAWRLQKRQKKRNSMWRRAGFDCLRTIGPLIKYYEPRYDSLIIPESRTSEPPAAKAESRETAAGVWIGKKYFTVDDYHSLYLSGQLTPLEVVESLLPLVRRDIPDASPHSRAFSESHVANMLAAAKASSRRYKYKCPLGPLDGVPTAVKDDCHIDGYKTKLGSGRDFAKGSPEDGVKMAWCVRKLEAAGAIIIGKTLMDEFNLGATGNNPKKGTPRNPYNRRYYTGGSSSGTAYAVSAGLIPIGLGSDGGGSIRIPASLCGVFGLKPTHGRISFKPGLSLCAASACLGPIAADIKSLATMFEIIAQPDPTSPFPPLKPLNLTPANFPEKVILGIPREWVQRSTLEIQSRFDSFLTALRREPCEYQFVNIALPFLQQGQMADAMTFLTETSFLVPLGLRTPTPASRLQLTLGRTTPIRDYILALRLRRCLMQHLAFLWKTLPGMIILTPTTACEGLPILEKNDLRRGVFDWGRTLQSREYTWLANFCGLPSLSVPMGLVPGKKGTKNNKGKERANNCDVLDSYWDGDVPVGLMATGEWASEEHLLRFGLVAERAAGEAGLLHRPLGPRWVAVLGLASSLAAEFDRGDDDDDSDQGNDEDESDQGDDEDGSHQGEDEDGSEPDHGDDEDGPEAYQGDDEDNPRQGHSRNPKDIDKQRRYIAKMKRDIERHRSPEESDEDDPPRSVRRRSRRSKRRLERPRTKLDRIIEETEPESGGRGDATRAGSAQPAGRQVAFAEETSVRFISETDDQDSSSQAGEPSPSLTGG